MAGREESADLTRCSARRWTSGALRAASRTRTGDAAVSHAKAKPAPDRIATKYRIEVRG